jgi:hypothetical protein
MKGQRTAKREVFPSSQPCFLERRWECNSIQWKGGENPTLIDGKGEVTTIAFRGKERKNG